VAPERLLTPRCLDLLAASRLALLAIDEAHCVSQWATTSGRNTCNSRCCRSAFPSARIALTATADAQTRAGSCSAWRSRGARVRVELRPPNIRYRIVEKTMPAGSSSIHPRRACRRGGIVYCLSRKKVEETAAFLQSEGLVALAYHAGMAARPPAPPGALSGEDGW